MIHEGKARRWGCSGVLMFLCLVLAASSAGVLAEEANASEMPTRVERLRGLAEVWGMVHLFHPALVDPSKKAAREGKLADLEKQAGWEAAVLDAIPEVEAAETIEAYGMALQRLVSLLDDGRTSILFPNDRGENGWITDAVSPIQLRMHEGRYLIEAVAPEAIEEGSSLVGMELVEVDGVRVDEVMETWLPIASGETDALKLDWVCDRMLSLSGSQRVILTVKDGLDEDRTIATDWGEDRTREESVFSIEMVDVPDGRYAHLRLVTTDYERSVSLPQSSKLLDELRESISSIGCEGVVLDLRGVAPRWASAQEASDVLVAYLLSHFGDTSLNVAGYAQRVYNGWSEYWGRGAYSIGESLYSDEGTAPNGRTRFRYPLPLVVLVDRNSQSWAAPCLISLQFFGRIYVVGEQGSLVVECSHTADLPGLGFSMRLSIPWWRKGAVEVPITQAMQNTLSETGEDPAVETAVRILRDWEDLESLNLVAVPDMGRRLLGRSINYGGAPTREARLFGLIKLWTTLKYTYPLPEQIDGQWDLLFEETLLGVESAESRSLYYQELQRMLTRLNDGNAFIRSGNERAGRPAITIQEIGGKAVVARVDRAQETEQFLEGIQEGMIVSSVDGRPVSELVDEIMAWAPSATEQGRRYLAYALLLSGPVGSPSRVDVVDPLDESARSFRVTRTLPSYLMAEPPICWIASDMAYVDLRDIDFPLWRSCSKDLASSRGVILDLRGTDARVILADLWPVDPHTDGSVFLEGVVPFISSPDAESWEWNNLTFHWYGEPFRGEVVILVDAGTHGETERAVGAFLESSHVRVVGKTTAGSPGHTSSIAVPGYAWASFSVSRFVNDSGRLSHGSGVVPDVIVEPTIQGIREGRDEVLEEAIRQLEDMILNNTTAPDGWSV